MIGKCFFCSKVIIKFSHGSGDIFTGGAWICILRKKNKKQTNLKSYNLGPGIKLKSCHTQRSKPYILIGIVYLRAIAAKGLISISRYYLLVIISFQLRPLAIKVGGKSALTGTCMGYNQELPLIVIHILRIENAYNLLVKKLK